MMQDDVTKYKEAVSRANLCLCSERQLFTSSSRKSIPVTLISGFLGAGKTSLIQHILRHRRNLRLACAISDASAAEINIDALYLQDILRKQVSSKLATSTCLPQIFNVTSPTTHAFTSVIWEILQSSSTTSSMNGGIDYILLETSGLMDPMQLIASLHQKFGKLTRAQLDAVVIVVDSDYLATLLIDNKSLETNPLLDIGIRQLMWADVIILNKNDLLQKYDTNVQNIVVKWIKQHTKPLTKVYYAEYGQIPLPYVMDITSANANVPMSSVSHEQVEDQWLIGGGNLNHLSLEPSQSQSITPPLNEIQYKVITRSKPITINHLQAWLQDGIDDTILRIKGSIYFQHDPLQRYELQLSGNRRVLLQACGNWQSPPCTNLVVLGTFHTPSNIIDDIFISYEEAIEKKQLNAEERQQFIEMFQKDPEQRFRIIPTIDLGTLSLQLCFEIPRSNILTHHHHDHMPMEVTQDFVQLINMTGNGLIFLYLPNIESTLNQGDGIALMAIDKSTMSKEIWESIDICATTILTQAKQKYTGCNCGF